MVAILDFTSMDTHTVGCYTSQPIDTTRHRAVGLCLAGAKCRNNLLSSVRLVFNLMFNNLNLELKHSSTLNAIGFTIVIIKVIMIFNVIAIIIILGVGVPR